LEPKNSHNKMMVPKAASSTNQNKKEENVPREPPKEIPRDVAR
jgi:hypothetical protein